MEYRNRELWAAFAAILSDHPGIFCEHSLAGRGTAFERLDWSLHRHPGVPADGDDRDAVFLA